MSRGIKRFLAAAPLKIPLAFRGIFTPLEKIP
jgi:hypothetical protein